MNAVRRDKLTLGVCPRAEDQGVSGVKHKNLDTSGPCGYLMKMQNTIDSKCDVTIDYLQESIDISDVGFSGTFYSEPVEPGNGYPGFVEANVKLDNLSDVVGQVQQYFADAEIDACVCN